MRVLGWPSSQVGYENWPEPCFGVVSTQLNMPL